MSQTWQIDPETKSKLLALQKSTGNDQCRDCDAPSPQWASPKFGIFICLNCAGIHRGLGVHISFVRSITMDGLKVGELVRMEQSGGNEAWKAFFDAHETNIAEGRVFAECTIQERYAGDVGEEWKERLAAKVEGREYVPLPPEQRLSAKLKSRTSPAPATPNATGKSNTVNSRSSSSSLGFQLPSKEANEAYFAQLEAENSKRSESLPPSKGGKYTGFGGGRSISSTNSSSSTAPAMGNFQDNPLTALTKGFGWFASTIGQSAKQVHQDIVQPTAQQEFSHSISQLASSGFANQARGIASTGFENIQTGARGAVAHVDRFVNAAPNTPSSTRPGFSQRPEYQDSRDILGGSAIKVKSNSSSGSTGPGSAASTHLVSTNTSPTMSIGSGNVAQGSVGTTAMRNRPKTTPATPATDSDGWVNDW